MSGMRISKQNINTENDAPAAPNPRLLKAGEKQYSTFSDLRPVDTYNTKVINADLLPELHDPTHKQGTFKVDKNTGEITQKRNGALAVSFYLRSAFAAIEEVHVESSCSQLSSITVNFDHEQSDRMVEGNASKKGATFYSNKLITRFKRGMPKRGLFLQEQPRFMVTLEDSVDGSLHANIIMRHHPEDERAIREMLKVEAKDDNNAVSLKTEYELWLDAAPGAELWQLNEMERDEYPELCSYPLLGTNKHGQKRFYRMTPVDSGMADYMSKELNNLLRSLSAGTRLSMDSETKKRAAEIYKERYKVLSR